MKRTPLEPWIAAKIGRCGQPLAGDALAAHQLHCLQDTLHLIRSRSGFYRRHLADAPEKLSCLGDLTYFPFTTAADICAEPLRFLCVSQGEIERVVTLDTSGTTGPPKRLYFTRDDQELTIDFFGVGMSTMVESGDRVLILLPCERPGSVGDLLAIGLERIGVKGIKHGPVRDAADTLEVMTRENVTGLVGVPTQVLALSRLQNAAGFGRPVKLKSVLLTTDHVPPSIVAIVERTWDGRVFNHYGMTEMGLGGGVQCAARCGYHVREADLLFEVVDPVTGAPLPDGDTGEVVVTTLTRRGMPLIRYRTGDLSRFLPAVCPCGTVLRTLATVRDRINGRFLVNGRAILSMADLDDLLFPIPAVLDFEAALVRQGDRDALELLIQVVPDSREPAFRAVEVALEAAPVLLRAGLDEPCCVAVEVVEGDFHHLRAPSKRIIRDRRT